jgi:hypothetical protein
MGLKVSKGQASPTAGDGSDEESDEQFEERIYLALMRVARTTSQRTRSALASCVMLGTPYEVAPDEVREAIREFVDEADL